MSQNAALEVGGGDGRLARRDGALLFVAGPVDVGRWRPVIDAFLTAGSVAEAREIVTAAAIDAGLVTDPFVMVAWGNGIDLMVLGDIAVRTDLPSVPMLSGSGSATWVEHRVAHPPSTARLEAGATGAPGTRLDAGVVAAGGFTLALAGPSSLPPPSLPPPTATAPVEIEDTEITLSPTEVVMAAARTAVVASTTASTVPARRCTRGHSNPPHAAQCRMCGDLIGPSSVVEQVDQPVLARVVLPDGAAVDLDRTIVLGRRPEVAAARAEPGASIVAMTAPAEVSRTHLVLRAEGWSMTATDCASRGRTVLASPGECDPVVLEPWVPHEVTVGDTLYLGGPTQLHLVTAG